jgi:hypothetical protein
MNQKYCWSLMLKMIFLATVLFASGCKNDGADTPTPATYNSASTKCASFHGKEAECKQAKEDSKACVYDGATKQCSVATTPPLGKCEDKNENDCKGSDQCIYVDDTRKCNEASDAEKGKCGTIQLDGPCTANTKCNWDGSKCIEKPTTEDIFTWTEATLPAGAAIADVSQVAVSRNHSQIYAYKRGADATTKGLYHSDDDGATWTRVGNAGDGILSARPFENNVINPALQTFDTKTTEPSAMIATEEGAVIFSGKKIMILKGAKASWGLDASGNYDSNFHPNNKIQHLKNEDIKFVDVITTAAGLSVVFGQQSANSVFIKDAAGTVSIGSTPKYFKTRLTAGANHDQIWLRAGNTHNDHLLLASTQGIWEFPNAHTNPDPAAPTAADFGKTEDDSPRLFPEPDGADINWKSTATPNLIFNVIGSFDNNGVKHYYAGLANDTTPGTGGLAHFNGTQAAGQHAEMSFSNLSIVGVVRATGVIHLMTSDGLKGVNVDGSPNAINDYTLANLDTKKHEMMSDKSAVGLDDSANSQVTLFGNTDKMILWVKTKGIYVREKSTGQPRP